MNIFSVTILFIIAVILVVILFGIAVFGTILFAKTIGYWHWYRDEEKENAKDCKAWDKAAKKV